MKVSGMSAKARALSLGFIAAAIAVAGCSGGGKGLTPVVGGAAPGGSTSASILIKFPLQTTSSFKRNPKFVSPATNGVDIFVYAHPQSANPSAVAHLPTDVSPSSTACAPDPGGTRTCTVALPIVAGTYDFTFVLYDAAPVTGSFASAKQLGAGSTTKTIVRNADNLVTVAVNGTIASLALTPGRQTFAVGAPKTLAIGITPLDADLDTILAGSTDPYLNPITISVSDTGSHMALSLNGGAPATSVVSTQLSDRITLTYDGKARAGYYAAVSASATGATGASQTLDSFAVSTNETDFTQFGASATITVDEPHAIGPFSVQSFACGGVATASPIQGSGEIQTFTITAANANGTCNYVASNEDLTQSGRDFVDLYTPGPIPTGVVYAVPGGNLGIVTGYAITNGTIVQNIQNDTFSNRTTLLGAAGVARDKAGNIYVADFNAQQIDVFAPTANDNMLPTAIIAGSNTGLKTPRLVRTDAAGNIYVLNSLGTQADPNASITVYAPGSSGNVAPIRTITFANVPGNIYYGLAVDGPGNVYTTSVPSVNPNNVAYVLEFAAGASGAAVPIRTITGGNTQVSRPHGLAVDAAGNVYVTSDLYDNFSEYGPTQNGNAVPIFSSAGELNQPSAIAVEPDGTVLTTGLAASGEYIVTYPPGSVHATAQFQLYAADSPYSDISL
jgi:hypothetical protein